MVLKECWGLLLLLTNLQINKSIHKYTAPDSQSSMWSNTCLPLIHPLILLSIPSLHPVPSHTGFLPLHKRMPSSLIPQGLCTYPSSCLEDSFIRFLHAYLLIEISGLTWNITYSEKVLTYLFKCTFHLLLHDDYLKCSPLHHPSFSPHYKLHGNRRCICFSAVFLSTVMGTV